MLAAKIGKVRGQSVGPTGQTSLALCNPSLVRFPLESLFVTRFGRGTSSPAYKYKGHDRLRSFYPIESNNLQFSYFSPNPSFSNLMLFFACLYGVQGRLE